MSMDDSEEDGSETTKTDECPVCLNSFLGGDIGTPESCDHNFCLTCILEWSKNVNTCPIDRQVYHLVFVRKEVNGPILDKVFVNDNTLPDDASSADTPCEICGATDNEASMLLCDGCDLGFHMGCLDPPLDRVPLDEWFCTRCSLVRFGDSTSQNGIAASLGASHSQPQRQPIIVEVSDSSTEEESTDEDEGFATAVSIALMRSDRRRMPRTRANERVLNRMAGTLRARTRIVISSDEEEEEEEETMFQRSLPQPGPSTRRPKRRKRKSRGRRKSAKRTKTVKRTPKSRIAGRLGLSAPAAGQSLPRIKKVQPPTLAERTEQISSLTVLGSRRFLTSSDSASMDAPKPKSKSRMAARTKPVSSVPDLLGSLLENQIKLLEKSENVLIKRDGTLETISPPLSKDPTKSIVLPSRFLLEHASMPHHVTACVAPVFDSNGRRTQGSSSFPMMLRPSDTPSPEPSPNEDSSAHGETLPPRSGSGPGEAALLTSAACHLGTATTSCDVSGHESQNSDGEGGNAYSPNSDGGGHPYSPNADGIDGTPYSPSAELDVEENSPAAELEDEENELSDDEIDGKPYSPSAELDDEKNSPAAELEGKENETSDDGIDGKPYSPSAEVEDEEDESSAALGDEENEPSDDNSGVGIGGDVDNGGVLCDNIPLPPSSPSTGPSLLPDSIPLPTGDCADGDAVPDSIPLPPTNGGDEDKNTGVTPPAKTSLMATPMDISAILKEKFTLDQLGLRPPLDPSVVIDLTLDDDEDDDDGDTPAATFNRRRSGHKNTRRRNSDSSEASAVRGKRHKKSKRSSSEESRPRVRSRQRRSKSRERRSISRNRRRRSSQGKRSVSPRRSRSLSISRRKSWNKGTGKRFRSGDHRTSRSHSPSRNLRRSTSSEKRRQESAARLRNRAEMEVNESFHQWPQPDWSPPRENDPVAMVRPDLFRDRDRNHSPNNDRGVKNSRRKDRSNSHKNTRSKSAKKDRSHSREQNGSRSRKKDRSKSHQKGHSQSRVKGDSRSRMKYRSRSHEKDRSRSHEKDRSRSHEKDRSRSHEEDLSRSHKKDLSRSHKKDRSKSHKKDLSRSHKKDLSRSHKKDRSRSHEKDLSRSHKKDQSRSHKKDRSRTHEKDRSRSHEKDLSRSHKKDLSRSHKKDRSKSHKKDLSRSHKKDRSRSHEKDRSRSYEKDLSRSHKKDRSKIRKKNRSESYERGHSQLQDKDRSQSRKKDRSLSLGKDRSSSRKKDRKHSLKKTANSHKKGRSHKSDRNDHKESPHRRSHSLSPEHVVSRKSKESGEPVWSWELGVGKAVKENAKQRISVKDRLGKPVFERDQRGEDSRSRQDESQSVGHRNRQKSTERESVSETDRGAQRVGSSHESETEQHADRDHHGKRRKNKKSKKSSKKEGYHSEGPVDEILEDGFKDAADSKSKRRKRHKKNSINESVIDGSPERSKKKHKKKKSRKHHDKDERSFDEGEESGKIDAKDVQSAHSEREKNNGEKKSPDHFQQNSSVKERRKSVSAEIRLRSGSAEGRLRSVSAERRLRSVSAERSLRSVSAERRLRSVSVERRLRSVSAERSLRSVSAERSLRSNSAERTTEAMISESIQTAAHVQPSRMELPSLVDYGKEDSDEEIPSLFAKTNHTQAPVAAVPSYQERKDSLPKAQVKVSLKLKPKAGLVTQRLPVAYNMFDDDSEEELPTRKLPPLFPIVSEQPAPITQQREPSPKGFSSIADAFTSEHTPIDESIRSGTNASVPSADLVTALGSHVFPEASPISESLFDKQQHPIDESLYDKQQHPRLEEKSSAYNPEDIYDPADLSPLSSPKDKQLVEENEDDRQAEVIPESSRRARPGTLSRSISQEQQAESVSTDKKANREDSGLLLSLNQEFSSLSSKRRRSKVISPEPSTRKRKSHRDRSVEASPYNSGAAYSHRKKRKSKERGLRDRDTGKDGDRYQEKTKRKRNKQRSRSHSSERTLEVAKSSRRKHSKSFRSRSRSASLLPKSVKKSRRKQHPASPDIRSRSSSLVESLKKLKRKRRSPSPRNRSRSSSYVGNSKKLRKGHHSPAHNKKQLEKARSPRRLSPSPKRWSKRLSKSPSSSRRWSRSPRRHSRSPIRRSRSPRRFSPKRNHRSPVRKNNKPREHPLSFLEEQGRVGYSKEARLDREGGGRVAGQRGDGDGRRRESGLYPPAGSKIPGLRTPDREITSTASSQVYERPHQSYDRRYGSGEESEESLYQTESMPIRAIGTVGSMPRKQSHGFSREKRISFNEDESSPEFQRIGTITNTFKFEDDPAPAPSNLRFVKPVPSNNIVVIQTSERPKQTLVNDLTRPPPTLRHSPDLTRPPPALRHRSPDLTRPPPVLRRHSPDLTRPPPALRHRSPDFVRSPPALRHRSPDLVRPPALRRRSPDLTRPPPQIPGLGGLPSVSDDPHTRYGHIRRPSSQTAQGGRTSSGNAHTASVHPPRTSILEQDEARTTANRQWREKEEGNGSSLPVLARSAALIDPAGFAATRRRPSPVVDEPERMASPTPSPPAAIVTSNSPPAASGTLDVFNKLQSLLEKRRSVQLPAEVPVPRLSAVLEAIPKRKLAEEAASAAAKAAEAEAARQKLAAPTPTKKSSYGGNRDLLNMPLPDLAFDILEEDGNEPYSPFDNYEPDDEVDNLPKSAQEMTSLDKMNRQQRIADEVKISLKPFYKKSKITKDEYKEVMRKCVGQIYGGKSQSINPLKVKSFVQKYVDKTIQLRKYQKRRK